MADGSDRDYCTFRLADRLYGLDLLAVKEVTLLAACTPVPHSPGPVRGYMSLRGQILLVVDLRQLLGMEPGLATPDQRLILLKPTVGDSVALVVDALHDIVRAADDMHEPWDAGRADDHPPSSHLLVQSLVKLPGELCIVLRAAEILAALTQSGDCANAKR